MNSRFPKLAKAFLNRSTPGYMVFFVTPFCNCRCSMCFNRKVIDNAAGRKILSLDEIENIAQNFKGLHHVNFSGGEPFLREDFSRIPELFYRYSGTRIFACPTNSSHPDKIVKAVDDICTSCPDAWIRITQSLDGIGKDHDVIRGRTGLFSDVCSLNTQLLALQTKHSNLSIGIAMVMSKYNQGKENSILDFAYKNLAFSDFGVLYVRGDTFDSSSKDVDKYAYEKFVTVVKERARKCSKPLNFTGKLFTAINSVAANLVVKSVLTEEYLIPCRAGKNMVVMDDEGLIFPCEILEYYIKTGTASLQTASFGNIRDFEYDIRKVLGTEQARKIVDYIRNSKCHCSFECAMSVNVLYSPSLWPHILKNFYIQNKSKVGE
ncbi:MAG: radical SAM protein [Candidatus Hydrogenedentes bacterium]|nr:radical SAM protein [Candidatus Hydrogenedentota bacterium]